LQEKNSSIIWFLKWPSNVDFLVNCFEHFKQMLFGSWIDWCTDKFSLNLKK
jgi:hypothetical protein